MSSPTLTDTLRLWFGFERRVARRDYAICGTGLMAFKYAVDATAFWLVTGEPWTPFDYLNPFLAVRSDAVRGVPGSDLLLVCFALWTIPFVWIGASMTVRRAIDAGFPAASGLVFFLPVVNYVWMIALCFLPSAAARRDPDAAASLAAVDVAADLRAAALGAALGAVLTIASVHLLGSYGASLFLGVPFVMGFATAFQLNRRQRHGRGETHATVQLAVGLTGGALLLLALEGVLCLLLAWPVAAALAAIGAVLGRAAATQGRLGPGHALPLLLALPLLMGVESIAVHPPLREVVTTIDIDAPPERVWNHVTGFGELPPPSRWIFALGIAYPMRAHIEGEGVGAVRYCEFSTGPFVEPITDWQPGRRLAFDVVRQPEPMTETSPYRSVHAPHLLESFVSERGEFRLVPLAGGRTRLEGSTFYRIDLFPQLYWTPISDALIHAIHERVLEHVKALSEAT